MPRNKKRVQEKVYPVTPADWREANPKEDPADRISITDIDKCLDENCSFEHDTSLDVTLIPG